MFHLSLIYILFLFFYHFCKIFHNTTRLNNLFFFCFTVRTVCVFFNARLLIVTWLRGLWEWICLAMWVNYFARWKSWFCLYYVARSRMCPGVSERNLWFWSSFGMINTHCKRGRSDENYIYWYTELIRTILLRWNRGEYLNTWQIAEISV